MKYYILLIAALGSACVIPASVEKYPVFKPLEKANICIVAGTTTAELKRLNYLKDSWQIVSPCEVDLNAASTAVTIFYYMWEKEFGDPNKKVFNSLNKMTIKWGEEYKIVSVGYTTNGKRKVNLKASGVTLAKNYIWVKRDPRSYIHRTSFAHELVHTSLWASVGSPDVDHESIAYKGENYWTARHTAFIIAVNNMLWSLDI